MNRPECGAYLEGGQTMTLVEPRFQVEQETVVNEPQSQEARISVLEAGFKVILDQQVDMTMQLRHLNDRIVSRPSWAVTAFITFVCSLASVQAGVLATILLRNGS